MTTHCFANTVVVDRQKHEIRIDGLVFPYYTAPDPEIELPPSDHRRMPATLHIGLYADNVTYISAEGEARQLHQAGPSAESEWTQRRAKEIVYEGLADIILWLKECEQKRQEARAISKVPYPTEGFDF